MVRFRLFSVLCAAGLMAGTLGGCASGAPDGFWARGLAGHHYTEGARRKLEGDPHAALGAWARAAEAGHAKAWYQLAHLYGSEALGPRDQAAALTYAREAAQGGFAPALHYVGASLLHGWGGLDPDPAAAEPFLRRAVAADMGRARADLGVLLLNRAGGRQDPAAWSARVEGLSLLREAVADDDPVAAWRLGAVLAEGTHVPRDPARAVALYADAMEGGEFRAALPLARRHVLGDGIAPDPAAARALLDRIERAGPGHVRVDLARALLDADDPLPFDPPRARRLLERAATEDGRVRAHVALGKLLAEGAPGVAPDPAAALSHLRTAAAAGNGEATRYVGVLLEDQGRPDAALSWFLEAAGQGHAHAAVEAARILLDRGDSASARQAVALLAGVAADHDPAALQLARVARDGAGGTLPPDPALARRWFEHVRRTGGRVAAAQATNDLARMVLRGQGGPADARAALALFHDAAAAGHAWAALELGRLYDTGVPGIAQDRQAAWHWFREAAARGVAQGHTALAKALIRDGQGPEAIRQAFAHFERAAAEGHAWALVEAGRAAERGAAGQPGDPAVARAWYERALAEGVDAAPGALASLHERGLGVPRDDARALALYHQGARAGNAWATYKVGAFVAEGRGTPADPDAARAWLTAARADGVDQAADMLGRLERGEVGPFGPATGSGPRLRIEVRPAGF
ncbi:tetratricopeptide repeat protein [Roseospira navarrensis]|uniref:Sel1 repeat family protein n=1 Tax=Roseospira navarrensis TaxID=140058 RepID=A0A7X2D353_9PROT|nr:tetratricopeptide repeat protein [Roseospira navarrensis]MQX36426.1 hypothetical protein [Roseospira navarrensis]